MYSGNSVKFCVSTQIYNIIDKSLYILYSISQRERLQAELEYMERLRGIKRRAEVLPHRAQLDLLMGGKKVEFAERLISQNILHEVFTPTILRTY